MHHIDLIFHVHILGVQMNTFARYRVFYDQNCLWESCTQTTPMTMTMMMTMTTMMPMTHDGQTMIV